MFQNYFKVALRNFRKFKAYAFINIFGLAIGLACCILILLHVHDELSFDRFHSKADRLFRITQVRSGAQGEQHFGYTMSAMAPALVNEFPEVKDAVRFFQGWRLTVKRETSGPTGLIVRNNFFTDGSFFSMFDFPLIAGDRGSALSAPGSVVLTEKMAKQLFADEEALGKELHIEAEDFPEFGKTAYKVTGILRELPPNTHFDFNMLISQSTLERFDDVRDMLSSWSQGGVASYLLLNDRMAVVNLEAKLGDFYKKHRGDETSVQRKFYLQSLGDIHFGSSEIGSELNANEGDMIYVYVFALIAIFIAAIACINYMNLATARSMKRAKEVGLRKVVGAGRWQMIGQFLTESLVSALIAFLIAIGLVEAVLPSFNSLISASLSLSIAQNASVFFWPACFGSARRPHCRKLSCILFIQPEAGHGIEGRPESRHAPFTLAPGIGDRAIRAVDYYDRRHAGGFSATRLFPHQKTRLQSRSARRHRHQS